MAAYWRTFSQHLKETFGGKVRKIPLDAGVSCPNRDGTRGHGGCIYCDETGSGPGASVRILPIPEQIASFVAAARDPRVTRYLAYFQAFSTTHTTPGNLRSLIHDACSHPSIVGVSIATRPDCLGASILDVIQEAAATTYLWLEMGLQTASDATLQRINRRHTVGEFKDAVERSKARGLRVLAHVILGLPGEDAEDFKRTAELLGALGVDGVKVHPLHVVRGTRLHEQHLGSGVRILTLEEYVSHVADFVERLPPSVIIHRLTGERDRSILVAPSWCLDKNRVLREIDEAFRARRTRQGTLWGVDGTSMGDASGGPAAVRIVPFAGPRT